MSSFERRQPSRADNPREVLQNLAVYETAFRTELLPLIEEAARVEIDFTVVAARLRLAKSEQETARTLAGIEERIAKMQGRAFILTAIPDHGVSLLQAAYDTTKSRLDGLNEQIANRKASLGATYGVE